jgi:glucose-6-phosphate isomerase
MAGTDPLRDKFVIVDDGSGIVGFADWAEQLIAESTGKNGTGILPVVVADADDPEVRRPPADVTVARLVGDSDETPEPQAAGGEAPRSEVHVSGALGAQMLLWEVATAAAGRLLGINPFDQPDVESAKKAARGLLDASGGAAAEPAFTDGAIEVRTLGGDWLGSATTVATALDALFDQLDPRQGYVAVMAYLDRLADAPLADSRVALARRTGRPTTFGWGPRFLHSTGQFHKGGPATGVYLQVTTAPHEDLPVPGREFTFGDFIAAQAGGDAQVLADHGRPVLRIHLRDRATGVARLLEVLQ